MGEESQIFLFTVSINTLQIQGKLTKWTAFFQLLTKSTLIGLLSDVSSDASYQLSIRCGILIRLERFE
jgi:hypothetical protein